MTPTNKMNRHFDHAILQDHMAKQYHHIPAITLPMAVTYGDLPGRANTITVTL